MRRSLALTICAALIATGCGGGDQGPKRATRSAEEIASCLEKGGTAHTETFVEEGSEGVVTGTPDAVIYVINLPNRRLAGSAVRWMNRAKVNARAGVMGVQKVNEGWTVVGVIGINDNPKDLYPPGAAEDLAKACAKRPSA